MVTLISIGINGYGTIGKRIADAVLKNPNFKLVGVAKYSPDYASKVASRRGIDIFVPEEKWGDFEKIGVTPKGTIEDFLNMSSIIIDASPGGKGLINLALYKGAGKRAIFQGGEKPEVAEVSYSSYCNFYDAVGKKYVRVVSCNTTGLLRVVCILHREFHVRTVKALIIRRGADPREDSRGPINSIKLETLEEISHHARDANTVVPSLHIETQAVVVPTTLMHVQYLDIEFETPVSKSKIIETLSSYNRFLIIDPKKSGVDSTSKIIEVARDVSRSRNDIYENIVFENTVRVSGNNLSLIQAIHQESIVIPENIDAVYAISNAGLSMEQTLAETDRYLGVGSLKDVF
ncbi:MAG: type II glyceraldehyde-3-phosphate dehydrogenase [Thermosphaera sp.]